MANFASDEAHRIALERSEDHYLSYLLTRNFDDLEEAFQCARHVLEMMPPNARYRHVALYMVGKSLVRRYPHTRQIEDVTGAVDMLECVVQLLAPVLASDSPAFQTCMQYLSLSRHVRDQNLEGSVERNDLHVHNASTSERMRIENLIRKLSEENSVYNYFAKKIDGLAAEGASLEELNSRIHFIRQALKVFSPPPSDPTKIGHILYALGRELSRRCSLRYTREDNDEMIDCYCQALKFPLNTTVFVYCLERASDAFVTRYEAVGRREDLDNAVNYAQQAVANGGPQHRDFNLTLDSLAGVMLYKYTATGDVNDLNAAIQAVQRAIDIAEHDDNCDSLPTHLISLANCLTARFQATGQFKDLTHAYEISQRALDSRPHGHPRRLHCLLWFTKLESFLGEYLDDEEHQQRSAQLLQEATNMFAGNVDHFGLDADTKVEFLSAVGKQLFAVGRRDEGIQMMRTLIRDFPHNIDTRECHRLLVRNLFDQWLDTREKEVLDEAIIIARHVTIIEHSRADDTIRNRNLLGKCLFHRYLITMDDEDFNNALAVVLEGFQMSAGELGSRIKAGQIAVDILCTEAQWGRASELCRKIADLIATLSGRSLDCTDKQYYLQKLLQQVPTYVSIALQAGRNILDVVDMLETCRGSILGHMIDNQTDLDNLRAVAPNEAERLTALRDEMKREISTSGDMNVRVEQVARRSRAEAEIRACLEEIRKVEGFERFLLGATLSDIREAAAQGPILIVNIAPMSSNAIIFTANAAYALSLPELEYEKVEEYQGVIIKDASIVLRPQVLKSKKGSEYQGAVTENSSVHLPRVPYRRAAKYKVEGPANFTDIADLGKKNKKYLQFLEWLWDKCVKLIFQKLEDLIPKQDKLHVWWLGIGIASSLPFHAAGVYTRKRHESALARAISSYTPSLKFLVHGRRRLKIDSPRLDAECLPSKPEMLIVSMPSTPGMSNLEGVEEEANRIQDIVRNSFSAKHIRQQSSARETMEHMAKCQVVHFACHGQSILEDPLGSHLLLQVTNPDSGSPMIDKLTVREVVALNVSHGKLAFLSACSTAENRLQRLWDEALHLASGFWVAGYLHTIGNLWPAEDAVSVEIVEGFYRHLVEAGELANGQNVARALNEALIDVMRRYPRQPLSWVQFVHFGVC